MTLFIPWLPSKMDVAIRWYTDVRQMEDGTEQRSSPVNHPSVLFSLEYQMLGDEDDPVDFTEERRDLRAQLTGVPGERFEIPFRIEGSFLTNSASSGTSTIQLNAARSLDWLAVGRKVYVEYDENEGGFVGVVAPGGLATVGVNIQVTFVDPLPIDVTTEFVACPVVEVQQDPKQALGKYRSDNTEDAEDIGTWTLSGAMQTFYMYSQGTGISLTTYEGLPVFALPFIQGSDDQIGEEFDSGLVVTGQVLVIGATQFPKSLIRREGLFSADDIDAWRYFKKFLFTVKGRFVPFFRPTFRPDLFLSAQPSSPTTTLLIDDTPDYREWFDDVHTFRRLYLAMSDGSRDIVAVASVTDNFDGTLTLTLTGAYSRGADTIDNISFLEACRLGSDDVGLRCANGPSVITLETLTGDWKQVP